MYRPLAVLGNCPDPIGLHPVRTTKRAVGSRSAKTQRSASSKLRSAAIGSILLFTLIQLSKAEDHCGSIHGIVNNSEGVPLIGTPVSVTNQTTDATISVLTNSDGSYQFPKLPIGIYTLAIQAPGFQTTTIYGIKLGINMEFTGKIEMLTGKMTSAVLLPADAVTKSRCAHKKSQVAGSASPATSPTATAPH